VPPDACELTLVHDRLDGLEQRLPGMTDATRRGWSGTMIRLEHTLWSPGWSEGAECVQVARPHP
jgi:hypothetical protein